MGPVSGSAIPSCLSAFQPLMHVHRSVHNIHIERLWLDLTAGVGSKWKMFFQELEFAEGLRSDNNANIWLLHFLFLNDINEEIMEWAEGWNSHTMAIQGDRQRSPRDMFFFGMLQNGLRGVEEPQTGVVDNEDPATFCIDWDTIDNPTIREHHTSTNSSDALGDNPFLTHQVPD